MLPASPLGSTPLAGWLTWLTPLLSHCYPHTDLILPGWSHWGMRSEDSGGVGSVPAVAWLRSSAAAVATSSLGVCLVIAGRRLQSPSRLRSPRPGCCRVPPILGSGACSQIRCRAQLPSLRNCRCCRRWQLASMPFYAATSALPAFLVSLIPPPLLAPEYLLHVAESMTPNTNYLPGNFHPDPATATSTCVLI